MFTHSPTATLSYFVIKPLQIDTTSNTTPVYEFPFTLQGQRVTMVFTSVSGHLKNIDFAQHLPWDSTPPDLLLRPALCPVLKQPSPDARQQDILRNLKTHAAGCARLVLWLDCDREGENIAFEVIDVWTTVKTTLPARTAVARARFSTLVPEEIARAVRDLARPNQLQSEAVDARQEV